jgi:glycosyltransferase involved in cell wall biosynthesis
MKIIQLIYSLCSGGAERFVVSLSNQLAEMGHDVTVCMLLSSGDEKYIFNRQFMRPDVHFHSMGFEPGFSLRKVRALEQYVLSVNPDVVHCHLNVIPYVFRLSMLSKDIRFVHTLHNVAENASGKDWQRVINRFFYSKGYIVPVTISEQCQLSYMRFYDLPAPARIDNGCEMPCRTALFETVLSEVSSYKRNDSTPVFIHVARYHEQKNQAMLIDAFNELNKKGTDFILLVLGDGFDQGAGAELKAKACEKIHFLGLKSNVADYLLCADAFCLTSIYEGLPISLLEAVACGVVPVCTNVGGIPDVIENGVTGHLCSVSTEEYITCLERFISEEVSKADLKDYFERNFSISGCAMKYLEVYEVSR